MKYKCKIYLLMLIVAFASCSKQLNVFPSGQEVDGDVIVDKQSALTTLNGVYYLFANAGTDNNENPSILWCNVNEMIPSELSGLMTYPHGGSDFTDHTYTSSSGVSDIWDYGYKIVNAANGFIKNIEPVDKITASDKHEMTAEAKFLRAYANAELLFYYGQYDDTTSQYGIILRKDFVSSTKIVLPRNNVKDCYDFIFEDLNDAIAGLLPNRDTANYFTNVWAAKLLKARVLMIHGAISDYTEVVSLCKDIIANSPFALEANTKDIFLSKGLSSAEVMLGTKPYNNDIYKYNQYLYYHDAVGTDSMVSLFANDPRNSWMYWIPSGGKTPYFTKYFPIVGGKRPVAAPSACYAIRLTEAYLLEAEAIVASGGSLNDAKALLKVVMQHAGFTDFSQLDAADTPEALQLLIVKEEMKNFVGEAGQDWLAVRRLPFKTLQKVIPTIKSKTVLILPIPQNEMLRNTALKGMQNPGYGSN